MVSVAASSLAFGTLGIFTTLAYGEGVNPLPLLTWRFFFAALVLGVLASRRNRAALVVPKRDLVRYLALSVFGFGASSILFFYALQYADPAICTALLYAYPAFVTLGAALFFKERIPASRWVAIGIVFVGCILVLNVFGGAARVEPIGALLAVGCGVMYAAFNLMSQRWLPGRSSMTMMTYTFGFSALFIGMLTVATGGAPALFQWVDWTAATWVYMSALIAIPTIVATLLYLRGVRSLGASQSGVISTLEPLFTVVLAWLVLGDALGAIQLVGVALIVSGVAAAAVLSKTVEPSPAVPLASDELLERRSDWVGPEGETAPEYVLEEIAQEPVTVLSPRAARKRRIIIAAFGGIVALILLQIVSMLAFVWWLNSPLPDISAANIEDRSSLTSTVFAADGSVLATWHGDENRELVAFADIPEVMTDATVAIEDRRFWDHSGVDLRGIVRALKRNYDAGVVKQGGSTITQQLMKMLYTGDEQTIQRKIDEALKATRVELGYSKEDVMTSYLNMAYFGSGAYGVGSASEKLFGKPVQQLTLPEAATLAGMLRSPSAYDPYEDPAPVISRRNVVLATMRQEGMISEGEYEAAVDAELTLAPRGSDDTVRYPFFVDTVRRELVAELGEETVSRGGLKVFTTIDPALQDAATVATSRFAKSTDPEVSVVSIRYSDGAVLAMVAGRDWNASQFNLATQGKRQPGSAFKPFVLAAALQDGRKLSNAYAASPFTTTVKDEEWNVQNYSDSRYTTSMTLHQATVWSVNTVYARLIMDVGPEKVVEVAAALGIQSQVDPDPAIALGGLKYGVSPLEMASAYGSLANGGSYVKPTTISVVLGRDGERIYEPTPQPTQAVSAAAAQAVCGVLREVVTSGTGVAANVASDACGKTGTTQSYRDAWFVGWSNGVATSVWMGYPQAQIDMSNIGGRQVTGGSYPAEMWAAYMRSARTIRPDRGFAIPASALLTTPELGGAPANINDETFGGPPVVTEPATAPATP